MNGLLICFCLTVAAAFGADKLTAPALIALTKGSQDKLREALVSTLGADNIKNGTAVIGHGPDFIWAVEAASRPMLTIDEATGPGMRQIARSNMWYAVGKLGVGTGHEFEYRIGGKPFGGKKDVPAYGPESYLKPGVPEGKLSDKFIHTSKIYDGMKSNYWIYVPAGYDPKTAAALMVIQDGQLYGRRDNDRNRFLEVLDNLIYEKKLPVMIAVLIQPGEVPEGTGIYREMQEMLRGVPAPEFSSAFGVTRTPQNIMRSVEYDTVSDRYARFLRDELLPEVEARYNIRRDAYSHAITGFSSGGICAFNVAWQQPGQFSHVLSWIGSFAPLQRVPDYGGQAFPAMVVIEPRRNIRVWAQDGADDSIGTNSWPLQNLEMANALKLRGYDFHFSYGVGTHDVAQGSAEWPRSLTWLWRDYDPAKTEQTYEQEAAEAARPPFRVKVYNRDHGPEN